MEQTDFLNEEQSDLLTVREVARCLRVDCTSVRRWIHDGILDAIRLPGNGKYAKFRIRKSTLERILEKTSLREVNHAD
jgi:excisionase family DNA binding protein